MPHRISLDDLTSDQLDALYDQLDALRKRSLTQLGELGIAHNRLDRIRDAARLHRQQLIGTSELYAVIEALDGAPTAAQEEQAAPVDWQDIAKRRERELKTVGEARHRAEAAITRVRTLAGWALNGWSDISPRKILDALDSVLSPTPAATQATDPYTGLIVQPYRNDRGEHVWVFRCWGTSTCDGHLSLDHHTRQSAERARDRHIAENHAVPTDLVGLIADTTPEQQ